MEASKWLKEEVAKAEKQLLESRAAFVEFVVDNGVVSRDDSGLGMVADLMNKTMEGHLRSQEARLRIGALSKNPNAVKSLCCPKITPANMSANSKSSWRSKRLSTPR